ncbi:unnamed protein product [Brassica oleracea var. botrytis]
MLQKRDQRAVCIHNTFSMVIRTYFKDIRCRDLTVLKKNI